MMVVMVITMIVVPDAQEAPRSASTVTLLSVKVSLGWLPDRCKPIEEAAARSDRASTKLTRWSCHPVVVQSESG